MVQSKKNIIKEIKTWVTNLEAQYVPQRLAKQSLCYTRTGIQ